LRFRLDKWREKVGMRSMRVDDSCPYCKNRKLLRGFNDLATTHPELVAEWDFERNGDLGPDGIVFGSARKVWWRCGYGHAWQISAYNRTGGADRKVLKGYNDLDTTHPDIVAMWHPRMNKRLKPTGVQAISRKLVWWRGECGHVYQMAVRDRVRAKPGQAGLLPVLFGEEEAREADKARLALGPSARKEWGASVPPAYRRDFATIGLGGHAWQLWGPHRF